MLAQSQGKANSPWGMRKKQNLKWALKDKEDKNGAHSRWKKQ